MEGADFVLIRTSFPPPSAQPRTGRPHQLPPRPPRTGNLDSVTPMNWGFAGSRAALLCFWSDPGSLCLAGVLGRRFSSLPCLFRVEKDCPLGRGSAP